MASRDDDDDETTTLESSLDELLQKKAADPVDVEEDEVLDLDDVALGRDADVVDPLVVKAVPQQANEFTCARCFLVKHRSQLADSGGRVCVDCA